MKPCPRAFNLSTRRDKIRPLPRWTDSSGGVCAVPRVDARPDRRCRSGAPPRPSYLPEIRNPKPETRNPKLDTQNCEFLGVSFFPGSGKLGFRPLNVLALTPSGCKTRLALPKWCTLHPTPYTLHPTPDTLHPTPYTLHPTPHTLHLTPYTCTPYTWHPTPHTLHPTPNTSHPTPHTLHQTPYT